MAPQELRFSVVVPVYDEEDNVEPLLDEITEVLTEHGPFEILFVDDGSTDDTARQVQRWRAAHAAPWLRLVRLDRRCGQSAAVLAGAERARGAFVMTLDGDRQNDPRDLVRILALLEAGECDGVTGVRVDRHDTWTRRVASRIGNGFRNWVTGDRVVDSACGIKGYRRELFTRVPGFDGMHRFMATLVRAQGGTVVEIPVAHRERVAGVAKYGVAGRAIRGIADCLAVRWMIRRALTYQACEEES